MWRKMKKEEGWGVLQSTERKIHVCHSVWGKWSVNTENGREYGSGGEWKWELITRQWKWDRERLDTSKTSSSTCASGKTTSIMLGWPRGSPFSSREKMTWYPRIWPCCFPCRGGFQVTRMAVEFMASTSNFLGGAPGTGNQNKKGGEREGRQNAGVKQTVRQGGKCKNMLS